MVGRIKKMKTEDREGEEEDEGREEEAEGRVLVRRIEETTDNQKFHM